MTQLENLNERFTISLNEHNHLEKRLITILRELEKCSTLTGNQFTLETREYLQVCLTMKIAKKISIEFLLKNYQAIQHGIRSDLQKLPDDHQSIAADSKSSLYLQQRYEHLKDFHLKIEEKLEHLRVSVTKRRTETNFFDCFFSPNISGTFEHFTVDQR